MGRPAGFRSVFGREVVHAAVPGIRTRILLPSLIAAVDGRLRIGLLRRPFYLLLVALNRSRHQLRLYSQEGKRQEPLINVN